MSALRDLKRFEHYLTLDEYLMVDRASQGKHEYLNGKIYDMAGGSETHNLITGNVFASFHAQRRSKGCKTYVENMRVITPSKLAAFPDVIAVCGDSQFLDDKRDVLLNPTVIVEVLSPSTELYDRSTKREHYQSLSSLRDYLLIRQDMAEIEHFSRAADAEWTNISTVTRGRDQTVELPSIGFTLALSDVYADVELENQGG